MDFTNGIVDTLASFFNETMPNSTFYWVPADFANATFLEAARDIEILKEPWLVCIIVMHFLSLAIVTCKRKSSSYVFVHLVALLCLCYASEPMNEVLAKNYKYFAHHQYFDSGGIFIICIWSVPIIVQAFVCLAYLLFEASNLLVAVKRKELKQKSK